MFVRRLLPVLLVWHVCPVLSTRKCTEAEIAGLLPSDASVLFAVPYTGDNNTFGNPADIAFPINATNLPAFCAVQIKVTSSATSSFMFGLFLPTNWNQRFLAVGNGGFAGGVNWLDMGAGLLYGFAVISTDTGHNSTSGNGTWALNNPEALTDWGYRAMHGSLTLGKEVVSGWYAENIKYSYYSGCSTGGRQGLKEIQISPGSFDGVLAGAPAWWTSHLQTWTVEIGKLNLPATKPGYIPVTLFPAIGAEVLRQCDGVDGVLDGIITNPSVCDFDYNALLCTPTSKPDSCLTAPQLDTLYSIYHDYVDTNNTFVFPHLELGSEAQWPVLLGSNSTPNPLGSAYVQDFLLNDPTWSWTDYDYSIVQLADALQPGNATANNFDLSPFYAQGGKLIQYHGLADGLIPTGSSPYFYNHVYRTLLPRGIPLDPWYRLFLVPGMQHCAGSAVDAPWYFAGSGQAGALGTGVHSVPGFMDAQHDALLALMAWVEDGTAPDSIIATRFKNDTLSMGWEKQRQLCPYPAFAEYVGGNVNVSSSWACP
jgi:feruloyl esterase